MKQGLFAVAVALMLLPGARAADPPIVFQTQPLGRVLSDLRAAAKIVGGDEAVKGLNNAIKEGLGEKGFDGLDNGRPIVGYVVLAAKLEESCGVFALPVTGEKDFLEFFERAMKQKPEAVENEKGLYLLPVPNPELKAYLRFSEQYAYIGLGKDPLPHLEAKALIPMPKLFDPAERGLVAVKIHFDRIPLGVKLGLPKLFEDLKTGFMEGFRGQAPPGAEDLLKNVVPEYEKLLNRYAKLSQGADVLAARLLLDLPTTTVSAELSLNAKPDSELSKAIAARKPTTNQFAALLTSPDTVVGFKARLPLFEEEIRSAAAAGLEAGAKEAGNVAPTMETKALVEELFKGLVRTVKKGEFDLVGAVRGPDKNGWFSAVGAVAFEDPAALEKELKKVIEKEAPPEFQEGIKWDAAKVGNVNIHTMKIKDEGFFNPGKVLGGADCMVAFAFAPKGIFAAIGPDPIPMLKEALAVKPTESPVLEIVANPARMRKLINKVAPDDPETPQIQGLFDDDDKLISGLSLSITGGKELKANFSMNLKGLPRVIAMGIISKSDAPGVVPPPPPVVDKDGR